MSIVNENTPEDAEMFNVSLTLDPADRTRLGDRVTVSANVATVTIQDNDGKHVMYYHSATTLCVNFVYACQYLCTQYFVYTCKTATGCVACFIWCIMELS